MKQYILAGMKARSRRLVLFLGMVDQALVSFGSFLFLVLASQFLQPNALGSFAFGVSTMLLVVSITRALSGEALLVRAGEHDVESHIKAMLAGVILISFGASLLTLLAGTVLSHSLVQSTAISVLIFGALLQDAIRHSLIGLGRSRVLIFFDVAGLAGSCLSIFIAGYRYQSPIAITFGWGLCLSLVSFLFMLQMDWNPDWINSFGWFRDGWYQSSAFAAEAIMGALVGYLTLVVIAVFTSSAEVAAFRSTVTLYGLTSIAVNFLRSTVMRELSVRRIQDLRHAQRVSLKMLTVLIGTVFIAATLLLMLPDRWGESLLGATWPLVSNLIIPGGVNRLCATLAVIPLVLLRVLGVSWRAARARILVSFVSVGLGPVGAYYGGASGALYAESLAYCFAALLLVPLVYRTVRLQTNEVLT